MAKLSQSEQFDRAVSAMLESRNSQKPAAGAAVEPFVELAAKLRGLPRQDFKARLKNELQGGNAMATQGPAVQPARESAHEEVKPSWIREGFRSITPYLIVERASEFIDFAKSVFGASERFRVARPGTTTIMHAEIQIGDSIIELAEANAQFPARPAALHHFVHDPDATYQRAVAAGAESIDPPSDRSYGERSGTVKDSFGNNWYIAKAIGAGAATHVARGLHEVNLCLLPEGAPALIDFIESAFGGETIQRVESDGVVHYAEVKIGNSVIEVGEAHGSHQPLPPGIHLYVPNVDEVYARAMAAGGASIQAPTDQPYGDRSGGVRDAFGNMWFIATHRRDVEIPEMKQPQGEVVSKPKVNWSRSGFHTVTPYITVVKAPELVDFMKQVFDAQELFRDVGRAGGYHIEMKLGDSMLIVGGGLDFRGTPMPTNLWTYVKDVDATYQRALAAGGTSEQEPKQMPYGERGCTVKDAFGNNWYIATYNELGATGFTRTGLQTVTPYLHLEGAANFIEFLKQAFGAEEVYVGREANGRVSHAQIRIGDSVIAMSDATPTATAKPAMFYLYVEDSDALYRRAIDAGATSLYEPKDQPYGDHVGGVKDAMGNQWFLSTHIKAPSRQ